MVAGSIPAAGAIQEYQYDNAVTWLNNLVDMVGDHPEDPLYSLIEILSDAIETYDKEHYPI